MYNEMAENSGGILSAFIFVIKKRVFCEWQIIASNRAYKYYVTLINMFYN